MKIRKPFLLVFPLSLLLFSCGEKSGVPATDSTSQLKKPSFTTGQEIEVKTFPVKDSADKIAGWGYDLYVNGKKSIHQPIIPAVAGNHPFQNEEEARRTGQLAADRMKQTGSLPTVLIHDLDSLQIHY